MRVLVTGGAGFIGWRLVNRLAAAGHRVEIVDSLLEQVHGAAARLPDCSGSIRTTRMDLRDRPRLEELLRTRFDVVYHLAAMTGVGQSMYQIHEYVDVNCGGTAALMQAVVQAGKPYPRVVLASSRAVYGEGGARCSSCGREFFPAARALERLGRHSWEHPCPGCGADSAPLPCHEGTPTNPSSVYGVTKLNQEQICRVVGEAYGVSVIILRYFNVYGPGQSPLNPYTGILSIFSRRLFHRQSIEIYEDGRETRDFVYIDDVVSANVLAGTAAVAGTYNVCSGEPRTVHEVALLLRGLHPGGGDVVVSGKYRVGDVRHGLGTWERAAQTFGFAPRVTLEAGLRKLLAWLTEQVVRTDADVDRTAEAELAKRCLLR